MAGHEILKKKRIFTIVGSAANINLKPSECYEGYVELNSKTLCAPRLSKRPIFNISGTLKGIKLKLSEKCEKWAE